MSKAAITVKFNGNDVNGNKKFVYNFTINDIDMNEQFKYIGRITKNGVSSQWHPQQVEEFLTRFGFWLDLKVGINLGKAQKAIDKCNCKSGCNKYCHNSQQDNCNLLKTHSNLLNDLELVRDFKECKVTILE